MLRQELLDDVPRLLGEEVLWRTEFAHERKDYLCRTRQEPVMRQTRRLITYRITLVKEECVLPLWEQLRRLGLGGPPRRSVTVLPLELLRGFA